MVGMTWNHTFKYSLIAMIINGVIAIVILLMEC
jgi:uncharacterized membrane protein